MAVSRKIQVTFQDTNGDKFTAFNGNWGQIFSGTSVESSSKTFMKTIQPLIDGDIVLARVTTADVFYPSAEPEDG